MNTLKHTLRSSFLRVPYLWLANRYRGIRRLFAYPDTARVGVTDHDTYWENKAQTGLGQLSPWRLKRAKVFVSLVSDGDYVLDLGVGDGALLEYIMQHRKINAYGLDASPKAVAFCRERGLNVDLADLNRPLTDYIREPFDHIILSEIIEHLPDPEKLLNDLRPFVRKSFIISIPNTGFHQHRLRLLMGKFPLQWVVTPGEHVRFWTLADFRWWADQMRFELLHIVPYQGTPFLRNVWPSLFAAAFVYALRPCERQKE